MSTSHFQTCTCSTNKDKHVIMCCFNEGISLSIHGKYIKQDQTRHTRYGCLCCFSTPKLNTFKIYKLYKNIKHVTRVILKLQLVRYAYFKKTSTSFKCHLRLSYFQKMY